MKLGTDLVVFITGGASGLGEATARYVISHGCRVAIADMNEQRMAELKKELGEDQVATFVCNVTDEKQVK